MCKFLMLQNRYCNFRTNRRKFSNMDYSPEVMITIIMFCTICLGILWFTFFFGKNIIVHNNNFIDPRIKKLMRNKCIIWPAHLLRNAWLFNDTITYIQLYKGVLNRLSARENILSIYYNNRTIVRKGINQIFFSRWSNRNVELAPVRFLPSVHQAFSFEKVKLHPFPIINSKLHC